MGYDSPVRYADGCFVHLWQQGSWIPFAASGGSGMGKTNKELADSCKGAELLEGKRFSAGVDETELKAWAEKY